jgi:hypothetical protein
MLVCERRWHDGDASTGRAATVFNVFCETFWNRIADQLVAEEQRSGDQNFVSHGET